MLFGFPAWFLLDSCRPAYHSLKTTVKANLKMSLCLATCLLHWVWCLGCQWYSGPMSSRQPVSCFSLSITSITVMSRTFCRLTSAQSNSRLIWRWEDTFHPRSDILGSFCCSGYSSKVFYGAYFPCNTWSQLKDAMLFSVSRSTPTIYKCMLLLAVWQLWQMLLSYVCW